MKTACLEIVDSLDQLENKDLLANQENKVPKVLKGKEEHLVILDLLDPEDPPVTLVSKYVHKYLPKP